MGPDEMSPHVLPCKMRMGLAASDCPVSQRLSAGPHGSCPLPLSVPVTSGGAPQTSFPGPTSGPCAAWPLGHGSPLLPTGALLRLFLASQKAVHLSRLSDTADCGGLLPRGHPCHPVGRMCLQMKPPWETEPWSLGRLRQPSSLHLQTPVIPPHPPTPITGTDRARVARSPGADIWPGCPTGVLSGLRMVTCQLSAWESRGGGCQQSGPFSHGDRIVSTAQPSSEVPRSTLHALLPQRLQHRRSRVWTMWVG